MSISPLDQVFSLERLAPYISASGQCPETALRLYAWNVEISAAFYGPLQILEITLRNALHTQLAALTRRPDWWDSPHIGLDEISLGKVAAAKAHVARLQPRPTPGHVVAELFFGFWANLLSGKHGYDTRLWRTSLHKAFPGHRGPRSVLHRDLYHLRHLRNRIAHHEPIHARHLPADHGTLMRILECMSEDTAQWVRANDRVPEVLGRRREACAGRVPGRF